MSNLYTGYDLSSCQGANVPFETLAQQGTKFIISKCAQGNDGVDPYFTRFIQATKANGMLAACYHFIYPLPTISSQPGRDPVVQAQNHFKASNGELAFIDCEWPAVQDWKKWNCSASQINDWVLTYLDEYTKLAGKKPAVYTFPYWAHNVSFSQDIAKYPLWVASYQSGSPATIPPWTSDQWVIWQNSGGTNHLPNGVPVDTDLAKDLSLWGISEAPVVASNPVPEVVSQPAAPLPPPMPEPAPQPVPEVPVVAPTATQDVIPSPARHPHPTIQLSVIENIIGTIVKVVKALLHIK